MPETLTFMMGEFESEFPTDRRYADNHMWALGAGPLRFGFTAYAVRLLQDVYFLDWVVEAPATLACKQEVGSIESKKAESALYAPIPGQLTQFNQQLMADPSTINVDKYNGGWLFEIVAGWKKWKVVGRRAVTVGSCSDRSGSSSYKSPRCR